MATSKAKATTTPAPDVPTHGGVYQAQPDGSLALLEGPDDHPMKPEAAQGAGASAAGGGADSITSGEGA